MEPVEGGGVLVLRPVPAVLHDRQPGVRDEGRDPAALVDRAGRVLRRPQHQRRRLDRAQVVVGDHVAGPGLRVLQGHVHLARHQPVGLLEDHLPGADQVVGHHRRVGHQPLQPGPHPLPARVAGRVHRQRVEPLHHLRVGHRAAHRVQHDPVHPLGVQLREPGGDPAAEGLAGERRLFRADRVQETGDLLEVIRDLQRVLGFRAVAVADEVDGPDVEMLRVRLQVPHIRLRVAGDAVQQHQRRLGRVAGVQVAGAVAAGVEEALAELDLVQVGPDAGVRVLGHQIPASRCGVAATVGATGPTLRSIDRLIYDVVSCSL